MAGRVQQDSFIDDSDACPLCVEELDLSDRNFKPCPCGYQVCQFCFNNIKNNMNGLCPACRRPYDDNTIEWKVISPEEFKADLQKQARKKAEIRQKEAQKKEAESLNRKHLAGLRVVQKNLVYVVGLNPQIKEEDLLRTLRGPQYFGQYGKIIKIVVSKSKDNHNPQSLGVHVTFARKEDAARCIVAVDGSENGGRTLRAQYGTTKYCAAYLRNENCTNKSCMFLHEPGEEKDSFTRQDLSSINAVASQRPAQGSAQGPAHASSAGVTAAGSRHGQPHQQPPVQHPPLAAATSIVRDPSKDGISPVDAGDGSALPSSAHWATRGGVQQGSRRGSRAPSASTPSPRVHNAALAGRAQAEQKQASVPEEAMETAAAAAPLAKDQASPPSASPSPDAPSPTDRPAYDVSLGFLRPILESVCSPDFRFTFAKVDSSGFDLDSLLRYPSLLDRNGGAKLEHIRAAQAQQRNQELARKVAQAAGRAEAEGVFGSGSLQLGGEPEVRQIGDGVAGMEPTELGSRDQQRQPIQPPSQHPLAGMNSADAAFGTGYPSMNSLSNFVLNGRGLGPSQTSQHHMLTKANAQPSTGIFERYPGVLAAAQQQPTETFRPAQHQQQQQHHHQHQLQHQHQHHHQHHQHQHHQHQHQHQQHHQHQHQHQHQLTAQSHARQASRFSFANDTGSATATVKPVANARFMAQQASMLPSSAGNNTHMAQGHHAQHHLGNQMYGSSIPIPPPGLKSATGIPVTGGSLFGQGQGLGGTFAGAPGFGNANLGHVEDKSDMLREMLRARGAATAAAAAAAAAAAGIGAGQAADPGKREFTSPFLQQFPSNSVAASASGSPGVSPGPQSGVHRGRGQRQRIRQQQRQQKKGKRQRHADTSSGDGGGVADLADPSILHARMQQQSGNPGLGQGLYGADAHGQDEQEVPGLDEASEAVDALVGDRAIVPGESEVTEAQVEQPAEIQQASTAAPETLQSEEPPAAQSHTAVAAVVARDAPAPSEVSSGLRVITPALPIIPIKRTATAPIQEQPPEPPAEGPDATPHAVEEKPESDSRAGASVTVEKPATQSQSVPGAEKQGSLRSSSEAQEKAEEKVEDKAQATAPAEVWTKVGSGGAKKTAKEAVKRSPPGKLDIMAATRELIRETQALSAPGAAKPSSQKKSNTSAGSTPPSAPNTRLPPAKTLRVVATPKLPTPQDETRGLTISTGDTASSAAAAQTHKSSAASTQVPATPVTDNPSELGSGTPGLLSRANSPAPARGGTGGTEATRESSKASKKKQRQEAKKQMKAKEQEKKTAEKKEDAARKEPEELLVSKMTDEEVAPIIGRKKKKPKPRSSPRKVPATPIISRPSSTVPSEMEPAKEDSGETEPSGAVDVKEPAEQAKQVEKNVRTSDDKKKDSEIEARTPKPEEDVAKETGVGSGPKAGSDAPPSDEFPHLTPARIMSSLIAEGELDPAKLAFFNPALGVGKTLENSLADLDAHIRKSITLPKHRAHLESSGFGTGGGGGGSGGAVRTRESLRERVPQSASIVRGLDPDQDARLAELEQRVFDMGEAEQRAFLAILNQTMASSSAADGADTSDGWSTMAAAALSGEPPSITVNLPPLSTSLLSASSSAMSFATNTKDQQAGSSLGSGSGIGFGTSLTSGPGLRTTVNNPYRTTPMPSTTILTIPFRSHNSDIIPNSTVSTANTANTANTSISNTGNNNSNSNNNSSNFTGELEDLARKVKEAEAQLEKHAKEGEELEKRLMALIMHNRRLVGLS